MINNQILAIILPLAGAFRIHPDKPLSKASDLRSTVYCNNYISMSQKEIRTGLIDLMVKVIKDFEFIDTIAEVVTLSIAQRPFLADRLKLPFVHIQNIRSRS